MPILQNQYLWILKVCEHSEIFWTKARGKVKQTICFETPTETIPGATKKKAPKTPEVKRKADAERKARGKLFETPEKREERLRRDREGAAARRGKKRVENVEMERPEETPEEEQQRQLRESYQRMVEMEEEDEELMFTRETPAERKERLSF